MSTAVRNTRQTAIRIFGRPMKRSHGATPSSEGRPGPNMENPGGVGRKDRRKMDRIDRRDTRVGEMERRLNLRKRTDGELIPGLQTRWANVNRARSAIDRKVSAS